MGQMFFKLPPPSTAAGARKYQVEGFQACEHCKGRGENPYPDPSLRFEWWDQGWCKSELIDRPEPERTDLEIWLAGGNE